MAKFIQRVFFLIRWHYLKQLSGFFIKTWYFLQGMRVGSNTTLSSIKVTWPHQVSIGNSCNLEHNIHLKFDGIWKNGPSIIIKDNVFIGTGCEFNIRKQIIVGNDSLIASGCKFIDHDHGVAINELMRKQHGPEQEIIIGNNVWLGCNVVVLKGVHIEDGAVVAAGAVVTKSIPPNEIWGGVPAKRIGSRN